MAVKRALSARSRRDRARVGRSSGHRGLDASSNGCLCAGVQGVRLCTGRAPDVRGDRNAVARAPPVYETNGGAWPEARAILKGGEVVNCSGRRWRSEEGGLVLRIADIQAVQRAWRSQAIETDGLQHS
jgi:hypothetical protein